MLTAIISAFSGPLLDHLLAPLTQLFTAYLNKQVTEAELREKLLAALIQAFSEIERAYTDSITKTFASFIDAARQNKTMSVAWAATVYSQLFVLVWHQWVIPFVIFTGLAKSYPSSGATVDWAYALLALCLGGGAIALKVGPGGSSLTDQLKSLAGLVKR